MRARRKNTRQRPLNGVLILDKPAGISSNAALQRVRRIFNAQKAGHTGNLDPLATGVLPLCFGEATKFARWGLDADKHYRAQVHFGTRTRTGDAAGETIEQGDASHLRRPDLLAALAAFRGQIEQRPPMFSALKQGGVPLYRLARRGIEVERAARPVRIHRLELLDWQAGAQPHCELDIHCSKGTYIRTLADDLGAKLGVGAHLRSLRRTAAGPFTLEQAVAIDYLEQIAAEAGTTGLDALLLPTDAMLSHLPQVQLEPGLERAFLSGQPVTAGEKRAKSLEEVAQTAAETDIVRIRSATGAFLGVGRLDEAHRIQPQRVIAHPSSRQA